MNLGGACIDQCWNGIVVLFIYCLNMYDENFTIYDIGRVWVSKGICVFETRRTYIPFKNLHTHVELP